MNRKRALLCIALLLLALSFALFGCNRGSGSYTEITPTYDKPDADILSLFDGWWTRPDDYESEGFSIVDHFMINAASGTWTICNDYGVENGTFDCWADGDTLTLDVEFFGEVVFHYDGYALVDDDGKVHYIPSGPISTPDTADFEGKWFLNGDPDSDYYLIEGNMYEFYEAWFSADEPYKSGTWVLNNITRILDSGNITEVQITFEDTSDIFGGCDLAFDENQVSLFDTFDKVFYIHEEAIGTYQGDTLMTEFALSYNNWEGPEFGDPYLTFNYYEKVFSIIVYKNGQGEKSYQGMWSAQGTDVTLIFDDGAEEEFEFNGDNFYLDYYGMTFHNDVW